MYHLFKKTFLQFDFQFQSFNPHLIASNKFIKDPIMSGSLDVICEPKSLDQLLEDNFNNSLDELFKHLYEVNFDRDFFIYLDSTGYNQLMITYLKSAIKKPTLETCYFLHQIHYEDLFLKSFLFEGTLQSRKKEHADNVRMLNIDEFKSVYDQCSISSFIQNLPCDEYNYELNLNGYLLKNNSNLSNSFLEKIENRCWDYFFSEVDILRSDVATGIYDYYESSTKTSFREVLGATRECLAVDPHFSWLFDKCFENRDQRAVKASYQASFFIEKFTRVSEVSDMIPRGGDSSLLSQFINLLFEKRYAELIELDMKMGHGSLPFKNSLRDRVNHLLIADIYKSFRENNTDHLKDLELVP